MTALWMLTAPIFLLGGCYFFVKFTQTRVVVMLGILLLPLSFSGCATKKFVEERVSELETKIQNEHNQIRRDIASLQNQLRQLQQTEASQRAALQNRLDERITQVERSASLRRGELRTALERRIDSGIRDLRTHSANERSQLQQKLQQDQKQSIDRLSRDLATRIAEFENRINASISNEVAGLNQRVIAITEATDASTRAAQTLRVAFDAVWEIEKENLRARIQQIERAQTSIRRETE